MSTDVTTARVPTGSRAAPREPAGRGPTEEMREFLAEHVYLTLATRDPDGTQHVVPVVYLYDGERFLVATSSATRKARNVAARPDVTVTVDDRDSVAWVSAVGTAELVTGPESRELNDRLYRLWMTDEGLAVVGRLLHEVEDVTLVVTPRRWRAWSFGTDLVPRLAAAGIPMDDLGRWFVL